MNPTDSPEVPQCLEDQASQPQPHVVGQQLPVNKQRERLLSSILGFGEMPVVSSEGDHSSY
jgi:hypothetical protein